MTVLDRIKKVSKMRGYNLTKVNDLANLGKNTIYSWKNKEPSHNNVQAVADVLGVSVDYLLGNTDDMHANKKADTSTPELIAAHWGIDLSKLSQEDKAIVMSRARDYVKGMVDALESK